jgi:hypothetical protein
MCASLRRLAYRRRLEVYLSTDLYAGHKDKDRRVGHASQVDQSQKYVVAKCAALKLELTRDSGYVLMTEFHTSEARRQS